VLELPLELQAFGALIVDDHSIEFHINRGDSLNAIFSLFSRHNLNAMSIRPKTNRLEELFVDLTEHQNEQQAAKL
jgi:ABC-2 type transport system ATP-binding protein